MSAVGSDRPDVAARYAGDVRQGLELMDDGRPRTPATAGRLRTAVYRAAIGVLRYSELDEDLELASRAIARLVTRRERDFVTSIAGELEAAGATIPSDVLETVIDNRGRVKVLRELEGLGIDHDRFRP